MSRTLGQTCDARPRSRGDGHSKETVMAIEYIVVGLIALGIAIYLAIALLRPDMF